MIKKLKKHLLAVSMFFAVLIAVLIYVAQLLMTGGDPVEAIQQTKQFGSGWLVWRLFLYVITASLYMYLIKTHKAKGNDDEVAYLSKVKNYGLVVLIAIEVSNFVGFAGG